MRFVTVNRVFGFGLRLFFSAMLTGAVDVFVNTRFTANFALAVLISPVTAYRSALRTRAVRINGMFADYSAFGASPVNVICVRTMSRTLFTYSVHVFRVPAHGAANGTYSFFIFFVSTRRTALGADPVFILFVSAYCTASYANPVLVFAVRA